MKKYKCRPYTGWPGKLALCTITCSINSEKDIEAFHEQITDATGKGHTILNCGINGTGAGQDIMLAWAILGANVIEGEPPKEE